MNRMQYLRDEIARQFKRQGEAAGEELLDKTVVYALTTYDVINKTDAEVDEIVDFAVEHIVEHALDNFR